MSEIQKMFLVEVKTRTRRTYAKPNNKSILTFGYDHCYFSSLTTYQP